MKSDSSSFSSTPGLLRMGHRWMFQPSSLPTPLPILLLFLFLLSPVFGSAMPGPDYDFRAQPRFICTPLPVDADPACFPPGGPSMGSSGAGGPGHHGSPGGGPNGFWGMTEDAKTTILHLRESLVQQKETILDQRETIRELTAKLSMCEGFGRGMGPQDDHHGDPSHPSSSSHHGGGHNSHAGKGHRGKGNHVPGGHRSDGGHGKKRGKDKHVTAGDMTSSPEQMSRMLQALKERLENLQQSRNTSTTYSSSLKELLQRKINALEQQMNHRSTAALSVPDHHDDESHGNDHDDGNPGDGHHTDAHNDDEHHDDGHHDDSHHEDDSHRDDDDDDSHLDDDDSPDDSDEDDEDEDDEDESDDDSHHDNIADSHGYLPRTGYHSQGHRTGQHPNKLDSVLNHLHHTGSNRKKLKTPAAFQIGFPMRTNYMYGKVKRTLLNEIFALTLCLWIKGGAGPGLGTPFSYSVPGQANELVLIEWGSNPMELLVDDKAVTLPLSLSDGKWHHVCVTWTTRDGLWEAYQDGVKRGSGEDLSAWHPIKPGGVFILGQEQDTLGGRFDATQSFVGEMSDVQMWSHVLTAQDIYSLASCGSHLSGDVFAWSEALVELHGGVTKYPFNPCH